MLEKKVYAFISDGTAEFTTAKKETIGFYSYAFSSEKLNKFLYQYKPTESIECLQLLPFKKINKKKNNLIWSSETLYLVMSDTERTQIDFQSQDEFTELLFLINGSTTHRNN